MFKKIFVLTICLALCLSCMPAMAAEADIPYGTSTAKLTLVDNFDGSTWAPLQFGSLEGEDGILVMTGGSMADVYNISVPMATDNAAVIAGAKNFVIGFNNMSDGDVYFCFQPLIDGSNRFLSGTMADAKVEWVDKNGVKSVCEPSEEATVNNRYGFTIPYEASGYIIIPTKMLVSLGAWDTPVFNDASVLSGVGFHVAGIESTFIEFEFHDLYVCNEFPEYVEPAKPTASPSPIPTQTPIKPTATNAPLKTAAPTAIAQESEDDTGNISTALLACIIGGAVVVVGIAVAIVIIIRKKH